MVATAPQRSFVPKDLAVTEFAQIQPLYQQLLDREVNSPGELEKWLRDFSELSSVVDENGSRRYINKSCHTDDAQIEKSYLFFVEEIEPKIKPIYFQLQKKFLASPHRDALTKQDARYTLLSKKWQADVDIFRDDNVPLETELAKLNNEYDKTCGAMTVEFRGKEYTLQQLARFIEEPDRETREAAWRLSADRRYADREKLESVYDRQLPLRQQIAQNAGLSDYRTWTWKAYKRFDYTPEDCITFGVAIA